MLIKRNPHDMEELALRLNAIIETAIDGIVTIDERGRVETMNAAAGRLFGYEPSEIIGQNIHILMPSPYHEEHDGYIERYQKTREARIIGIGREVRGLRKNGSIFPMRLAVSETKLGDRTIYTGVIHDLTDVKFAQNEVQRLNEILSRQNEQLEKTIAERTESLASVVNELLETKRQLEKSLEAERELSEMKGRFLATASHEFRTPLASILSSAEILELYSRKDDDSKTGKHLHRIRSSVEQLNGILTDFLSISRFDQGRVEVNFSEFDLPVFCAEVIDEMRGLFKKGQRIDHDLQGELRPIRSDKKALKSILFNLLSNASKYSPEGQTIDCHAIFDEKTLSLVIRDRGIGIPEKDQKRLFENFFRASNVENVAGTGLGLSIVKRYAELLGGSLEFESEEEKGSVFTVVLPC